MPIAEQIVTVGEDGTLALQVPLAAGAVVRVLVFAGQDPNPPSAPVGDTGFAVRVLGAPAEDVWNAL